MSRTKDQAHDANNAVIAIAKEAAMQIGVELLIVVGSTYDERPNSLLVGVDAIVSDERIPVQLAAIGLGAAGQAIGDGLELEEKRALIAKCLAHGAKHAKDLWDRTTTGAPDAAPAEEPKR